MQHVTFCDVDDRAVGWIGAKKQAGRGGDKSLRDFLSDTKNNRRAPPPQFVVVRQCIGISTY